MTATEKYFPGVAFIMLHAQGGSNMTFESADEILIEQYLSVLLLIVILHVGSRRNVQGEGVLLRILGRGVAPGYLKSYSL